MKKILLFTLIITISQQITAQSKRDYLVTITTPWGEMHAILYDKTPKHKTNFLKLVDDKFYNDLLFHRIIDGFMIQGGDPKSKTAKQGEMLGDGDVGYKVDAEITPDLFHKKGALAAARDNNPQKASSGCQYYIVQGKVWNDKTLKEQMARSPQRVFTDEQKQVYKTIGGTPHLDGNYTVFGQVIDNLWVIDSVAKQPRNGQNRPLKDIAMKIECKKMRKKKITKRYGWEF
ncbi:peptidyl-prolyl cis-trans isomerase B (cyclophilin B) [Arcicella aurantiaca]|uniref:Peptidyl-prolyl cis-trans isomerase n=1 Tax=Arcicella aurantiaca TaxID=591202 RepID=A0A316DG77_9BACT|nr:peptidylprolyl isomerase [Arcicella aurantiaca]PWK16656.1 peptidyl-prolyl cis-trans isomerase B (cyclophilin B) [Arcicella aurantiaca]